MTASRARGRGSGRSVSAPVGAHWIRLMRICSFVHFVHFVHLFVLFIVFALCLFSGLFCVVLFCFVSFRFILFWLFDVSSSCFGVSRRRGEDAHSALSPLHPVLAA